jgi:hypothetical protein
MYAEVNAGIMHQYTLYQWPCLDRLWQSRIQRRIVSCWIFIVCLFMLNTSVMAQNITTWNKYVTNNDDGFNATRVLLTAAGEPTLVLGEIKEVFVPQSTVAAITALIIGLVLCCCSEIATWTKPFIIQFSAAVIQIYLFCIAVVSSDDGEMDNDTKTICAFVSCALGFLISIIAFHCPISRAVLGSSFGCFIGVSMILLLKPLKFIGNMAGVIILRIFLFVVPMVGAALVFYDHGPIIVFVLKAFAGSFALLLGADAFADTGFNDQIMDFFNFISEPSTSSGVGAAMMWLATVVLGLVGGAVKIRHYLKEYDTSSMSIRDRLKLKRTRIGLATLLVYGFICLIIGLAT